MRHYCVGRSNSGNKKNFLTKYSCSSNRFAKLVLKNTVVYSRKHKEITSLCIYKICRINRFFEHSKGFCMHKVGRVKKVTSYEPAFLLNLHTNIPQKM